MNEVISEIIFGDSELSGEMEEEFKEVMMETQDERSMYVITNESKLFGAASMLYEEPLHELAEKIESVPYGPAAGIYYAVFSGSKSRIQDRQPDRGTSV